MDAYTDYEKEDLSRLHGWWFTYNEYDEMWLAAQSEYKEIVKNDYSSPHILRAPTFDRLKQLIYEL